jgi:O-antigen ligase
LATFLIALSFTLYFSRMMFVGLILLVLSFTGLAKLTKKGFSYFSVLLVAIALFYVYLFNTEIRRDEPGIQSFLYKIKIAPSEIFVPAEKINEKNHAELWDHWRAYEANRAIDELNRKPVNYMFGKGFGSLIDLGFIAPLNDTGMRFIPHLHNGYVYVLYKTGIFALVLYLIFLSFLYLQSYNKSATLLKKNTQNLIAGIGLFFIFSSLITTGIYNEHEFYMFFLGGFLFHLQQKEKD